MPQIISTVFGKAIRRAARLRGGSGSALPGLFVEKIDPDFIRRSLAQLPLGVVLISGTNGKTTTTKIVVELLEGQDLKVFTNRTGSNFTRGVAAALLGEISLSGRLDADIAVLELDEAYAVRFVQTIQPRYSLILNVMRDQLDRFGEIDATAKMLSKLAQATTVGVTLNREDTRIRAIGSDLPAQSIAYFGLSDDLIRQFPDDDSLHSSQAQSSQLKPEADVVLTKIDRSNMATFQLGHQSITTSLNLSGMYNIFNAAAALTLVRQILDKKVDNTKLIDSLSRVRPAFGRGEKMIINGQPLELVLVKNPSGFRLGFESFDPTGYATMIAINDNYADGRDMSWLWDVDFSSLKHCGVACASGIRAYDMALRLWYDQVDVNLVETSLKKSLRRFLKTAADQPKRIYCTYTAMLALRRELAKITKVEAVE